MLHRLKRWRERRALDRELARLQIPPQFRLPASAQVQARRGSAVVSRRDVKAVAVTVAAGVLLASPLVGWSAYGLTIMESRASYAEARADYAEAQAAYEGAMAVETQDAPVPDDPLVALEQAMTPETPAGQEAATDLVAARAAAEAAEPGGITDLWPL